MNVSVKPFRPRTRTLAVAALIAGLTVGHVGCGKSGGDGAGTIAATYTVRGKVQSVTPKDGSMTAYIHHEEIADFVDREGNKTGMPSMSMPFGVASTAATEGLAAGDKVEFTFTVAWQRKPVVEITTVRKLPAETELVLTGM